ncbi:uncharacterized protein LOC131658582 [Vicia villosa]|uniref:uncharacterized protein LOC131658582 n=1 Tax=Vicia villosa TaxID=3911 RepID=UPI00273CEA0F|nr:uncharacterized protein LOC131658582 [Vicia villosa]
MYFEEELQGGDVEGTKDTDGLKSGSEDSAVGINFEDSDNDVVMTEAVAVDDAEISEDGTKNGKGKGKSKGKVKAKRKGKGKGKVKGKGKGKGKGKVKGKGKIGRPSKKKVSESATSGEKSLLVDDDEVDEEEIPVNLKGLSDVETDNSEVGFDEYFSEDDCVTKTLFQTFKMPKTMEDYKWELGTYFATNQDFKDAIRSYAIHNGRDMKFKKNDKKRMRVICKKGCPWEAYCAKIQDEETWQLRKIVDKHTCSRDFKVNLLNSKWLSSKIQKNVRENPNLRLADIMEKTQQKWNVGINRTLAYRAKTKAIDIVDGSFREQYKRIHDYAHELLRANPGSTVKVTSQPFQGEEESIENPQIQLSPHFQRMYICFKACKDSFFKCRPIIGLDGCFLKGYYGGQILAAIGRDPNDQMMPIAYAVVEGETKDSWSWFLELLIADLGGERICKTYTFISDQQKGLLPALEELLPQVDQRFCVRHLYSNFRKKFPGAKLKELMWKAATASYTNAFERAMLEMKGVNENAFKHLIKLPARYWSKAFFKPYPLCDALVNNMSEAFNSVFVTSRAKPIITMLEEIRVYLMQRWESNREKIAKFEGDILPNIKKKITKESGRTNYWIVRRAGEFDYEVRHISNNGEKYVVNLSTKLCSCRLWMLTGLPCCHAMSCMKSQQLDIEDFVPDCYKKSTYEACYASVIFPVNGENLWEKKDYAELQPPPIKRQPGRPKKKRTRDPSENIRNETQLKRANFGIKCSRCHMMGHNKSTCKLPPPSQSAQPETTQPEPIQHGPSQPEATQPEATQQDSTQSEAILN